MMGYHCDLAEQLHMLRMLLKQSPVIEQVLQESQLLGLTDYYIGAGCICQTVWNLQTGRDPVYGISDIDFAYFDDTDLSYEAEDRVIQRVQGYFAQLPLAMDVKNQARVHLWYQKHYGYHLEPYRSLEQAVDTWPTTATSVGVRLQNGHFKVYAPFGLNDLFGQIVRANRTQITEQTYQYKCAKWTSKWPELTVIPW